MILPKKNCSNEFYAKEKNNEMKSFANICENISPMNHSFIHALARSN
jgi:hypothetical protein